MWKDDKFEVPSEISAKGADEVGKYYTEHYGERYKDYDDLKGKAAQVETYSKFGKPEEIEAKTSTFDRVAQALRSGKVVVADKNGQLYAKDPSELTAAERKQVREQGADAGTGASADLDDDAYDELPPRKQRAYMQAQFRKMLDDTVASKEKEFGSAIGGAQAQQQNMIETMLQIQAAVQANPEIKFNDLLGGMAKHAANGAANPLKAALDEFLTPAQIERKAQERAAAIIAENMAKMEKERAEKQLGGRFQSPLQNMMRNRGANQKVSNAEIINGLRDKGWVN